MDAFTGEIRAFGFGYSPMDWAYCNGQLLAVQQFPALYSILGTRFGGDGHNTFGLPNLQSIVVTGFGTASTGTSYPFAGSGGAATVTLTTSNMPPHTHTIGGYAAGTPSSWTAAPVAVPAPVSRLTNLQEVTTLTPPTKAGFLYAPSSTTPLAALNSGTLSIYTGGGGPHDNHQPYLVFNYCICVNGYYPVNPN